MISANPARLPVLAQRLSPNSQNNLKLWLLLLRWAKANSPASEFTLATSRLLRTLRHHPKPVAQLLGQLKLVRVSHSPKLLLLPRPPPVSSTTLTTCP